MRGGAQVSDYHWREVLLRCGAAAIAARVLGPGVEARVAVVVAEIPLRPRLDRLTAPAHSARPASTTGISAALSFW